MIAITIKNINLLKERGFFHIFGSTLLNKIVQFCSGIILVRVLSKGEFGLFSYSQNILAFFLLANGFGMTISFLQFGSKSKCEMEKNEIIKFTYKIAIISSILIAFITIIYSQYGIFKIEEARKYFAMMSFYSITNIVIELIQLKNRVDLNNKAVAIQSNINIVGSLILMVIGGKILGITGVIIGKYIGNLIAISYGVKYLSKLLRDYKKIKELNKKIKKKIWKFSLLTLVNNSMSQLLYILDIFFVGMIIGDQMILASYKTATLIPFALNFIPHSIMNYLYPYFARSSQDKNWIYNKYKKIIGITGIINLLISMVLFTFSSQIISILFGSEYLDSVNIFKILSLGYFIVATFRIPAGYTLASIEKLNFNFYNTIICGILNIALNMILIKRYGSIGAGISTLIIFIVSGIIGNIYLYISLKNKKQV